MKRDGESNAIKSKVESLNAALNFAFLSCKLPYNCPRTDSAFPTRVKDMPLAFSGHEKLLTYPIEK